MKLLGRTALVASLAACGGGLDTAPATTPEPTPAATTRPTATPTVTPTPPPPSFEQLADLGPDGAKRVTLDVGDDDKAVLAWTTISGANQGAAFVADEGRGFLTEAVSAQLPGYSDSPSVALSSGGKAIAAFQQTTPEGTVVLGHTMIATREARGEAFRAPASIDESFSLAGLHAYEPVAVATPDGEQIVVWNQWRGTGFSVAVADRLAGGAWKKPTTTADLVSYPMFHSNAPRPAVNDAGELVISWYQSPDGKELEIFVSERTRRDLPLSRPQGTDYISPPGWPASSEIVANPIPTFADDGRVAIAWTLDTDPVTAPPTAARVFVAVRQPAETFKHGMPYAILSAADAIALNVHAFFVGKTLHVVWEDHAPNEKSRVVYARQDDSGRWSPPTVLSTPGHIGTAPTVAARRGRAVVAFAESDADGYRVVARVTGPDATFGPPIAVSSASSYVGELAAGIGSGKDGRVVVAWVHGLTLQGRVGVARMK